MFFGCRHVRRMSRLLVDSAVNVSFEEVSGKEHWWWDTRTPNDGGVNNDASIRKFMRHAVGQHRAALAHMEVRTYRQCTIKCVSLQLLLRG